MAYTPNNEAKEMAKAALEWIRRLSARIAIDTFPDFSWWGQACDPPEELELLDHMRREAVAKWRAGEICDPTHWIERQLEEVAKGE